MIKTNWIDNMYENDRDENGKIVLDYTLISDIQLDGIDTNDYPDFCDAFICYAVYDGHDMTDEELDALNEDYDYVYQAVMEQLF